MDEARGGRGRRSLSEKYEAFSSAAARRLRADALGTATVNGYTTQWQAEEVARALGLAASHRLLDLGGGRGWPGSHVARETGCSLVVCDLPVEALEEARGTLEEEKLAGQATLVRADGRTLPFASGSFDGLTHADVLC